MNNDNALVAVDVLPLEEKTAEIANQILNETDVDKVKDLTALFNLNQRKKNVVRLMKFNGLLDTISDQMLERFEKKSGEFSNADLLNYMQVIQSAIDRTQKSLDLISETPAIQMNVTQNTLNMNVVDGGLDRDAKERVSDAVKAILSRLKDMGEDGIVAEYEEK